MNRSDTREDRAFVVDGLQFCRSSEKIFKQMRDGGLDAVHTTICYHENFRETVDSLINWNRNFERYPNLIMPGRTAADIDIARSTGRTAVFFGLQNCSPIEDNIGLVEIMHTLGVRMMQLSYNNQSLLCSGCYEREDTGITRMGAEVIREMNRIGIAIDMSHSGERSTLEAIEASERPIVVTHSNPSVWHPVQRNKSDRVIRALIESGGMIGLSLYPHHLRDGIECTLRSFSEMAARLAEDIGAEHIGIGSDLCQDQPDTAVEWMRYGRWKKRDDSIEHVLFPPQPKWFQNNSDFPKLRAGLSAAGFSSQEIDGILGENWYRYYQLSFGPEQSGDEKQQTETRRHTLDRAREIGSGVGPL
jgi:microsomal dipeptidase-like Zn-dependent dipeptidase